jgi:hypothetical protein
VYVAGIVGNGDCIVQKWTYLPRTHGWMVWYPRGDVDSLGVPTIPAVPTICVTDGGDWAAPTPREQTLQPALRETIYTSPTGMEGGMPVSSGLTHVVPVSPLPWVHTVGTDANNDGTFESWEVLNRASWASSAYADWAAWRPFWRE